MHIPMQIAIFVEKNGCSLLAIGSYHAF